MIKRIIKLMISVLYFIYLKINNFKKKISNKKNNGLLTILYYHEILEKDHDAFTKNLKIIIKSSMPVSLDYNGNKEEGKYYTAITFDDAFQSVFNYAIDEMTLMEIPATIFVPTAYLGQRPGWDINNNHELLKQTIATKNQIKRLDPKLFTIGSHTCTHPRLVDLNEKKLKDELLNSKIELEKYTGYKVEKLAFPHGAYNELVLRIAAECGYKKVYTILPYQNNNSSFIMGRIKADPGDWPIELKLKIRGGYNWLGFKKK